MTELTTSSGFLVPIIVLDTEARDSERQAPSTRTLLRVECVHHRSDSNCINKRP